MKQQTFLRVHPKCFPDLPFLRCEINIWCFRHCFLVSKTNDFSKWDRFPEQHRFLLPVRVANEGLYYRDHLEKKSNPAGGWNVIFSRFLDFQQQSDSTGSTLQAFGRWLRRRRCSRERCLEGSNLLHMYGNFQWFGLKWWMVWVGKITWITNIIIIFIWFYCY